ncbi:hypothetical protein DXA30_14855 [Fusobacterium ulcerans]|jgi:hypothetical protein|nr:hypothetical protein DXA30_14855 [Fusobacterium ulcerans]
MEKGVKMKVIFILIFFLGDILIYGEQKKQELIKVKVKIGSSEYISYVQLSNKTELTKFKILREM